MGNGTNSTLGNGSTIGKIGRRNGTSNMTNATSNKSSNTSNISSKNQSLSNSTTAKQKNKSSGQNNTGIKIKKEKIEEDDTESRQKGSGNN